MAKKRTTENTNIVQLFINDLFGDHNQFVPARHFYTRTGIKQKRWGQIYRNEKSPTLEELAHIAAYFDKHISVITEKRQLNLFS